MSNDQTSSDPDRVGNRTAAPSAVATDLRGPWRRVPRLAICLTLVLNSGAGTEASASGGDTDLIASGPSAPGNDGRPIDPSDHGPAIIADGADGGPDRVAEYPGGIAARLRHADGTPVPGRLYLMMATVGSEERARLFEQTPFTHDRGPHADTIESNHLAVEAAEAITGNDIEPVEYTTAPGGGPSGGLAYLIAYLNLTSQGAFTAHVDVAATGEVEDEGYIGHIRGVDGKLGAARLAGAHVLFTSSAPSHAKLAEHAERYSGHMYRSRYGRATLESERGLDDYVTWGATRPSALDVVKVGHIADVAAYLCGAGADYACSIADQLGTTITSDTLTAFDIARAANIPSVDQLEHPTSEIRPRVSVSAAPSVDVVDADRDGRRRLHDSLQLFRDNALHLPDLEVRFFDDVSECDGHFGLFRKSFLPWRIHICSDLAFVITHELAHAWEAANLEEADRSRYLRARGLSNWNDPDSPWTKRGGEDAAFMVQQNLTATNPPLASAEWSQRIAAYELITGRRSPLRPLDHDIIGPADTSSTTSRIPPGTATDGHPCCDGPDSEGKLRAPF